VGSGAIPARIATAWASGTCARSLLASSAGINVNARAARSAAIRGNTLVVAGPAPMPATIRAALWSGIPASRAAARTPGISASTLAARCLELARRSGVGPAGRRRQFFLGAELAIRRGLPPRHPPTLYFFLGLHPACPHERFDDFQAGQMAALFGV
jgi:hypothetical protein